MRCPDCCKFVGLEMEDPEVTSELNIDEDGFITGEVRIARSCAECGAELKEATFQVDEQVDLTAERAARHSQQVADGREHELQIEHSDPQPVEERGSGRARSYFGASLDYVVTCSCEDAPSVAFGSAKSEETEEQRSKREAERWRVDGTWEDMVGASEMDEL